MYKNYKKTLCKHTKFQKNQKNKICHNTQKYNNFFVQSPQIEKIKKSSQCTKKDKEKNFFVQK